MSDVFIKYKIKGTFTDKVCGGLPADPNMIETHLALKGITPDTIEAADMLIRTTQRLSTYEGIVDKSTNLLGKDDVGVFLNGYQFMAGLRESMSVQKSITSWRSKMQRGVRVMPQKVYLMRDGIPLKQADGTIQTVVHAEDIRGKPQTSLKRTEYVEKADFEFEVWVAKEKGTPILSTKVLRNLLSHCEVTGFGALHTMGYGQCELSIVSER